MIVSEADCMIISCGLFYKICNLAIEFKSEIHPVTVDRDLQKKKKSQFKASAQEAGGMTQHLGMLAVLVEDLVSQYPHGGFSSTDMTLDTHAEHIRTFM